MHDSQSKESPRSEQQGSGFGALARIGWIDAGPVAMLGLGMSIASMPAWSFGLRDVLFWGVTALSGLLRYFDVIKFDGQNSYGQPATEAELRRYLAGLAVIGVSI